MVCFGLYKFLIRTKVFRRLLTQTPALIILPLILTTHTLQAQDTQTYTVHGTVLNSITHQPVARALVKTQEGNGILTDNDGNFEITGLSAGTQHFFLQRPGYEGERQQSANTVHTVMIGANMPGLTFYLTPNAVITGQVTLSTSDPADNIHVSAWRKHVENGRGIWTMAGQAQTNSEGAFRIGNLAAGTYLLYTQPSADQTQIRNTAGTISSGYPPVYYPGVTDASAAGMLTLIAGQQARADLTLTMQRFYSVTATVANSMGGPGGSFQIHDRSGRSLGFPVRFDPQTQTIHASVPSGSYVLQAGGYGRNRTYGRTEFVVSNAPVNGLSITVLPLHNIPVNIRKDFTANSNAVVASSGSSNAGLNLSLIPADDTMGQGYGGGNLRPVEGTSDGRSFELENASPGRYWIMTSPFEGYVSSITSGGVDLAREPLTIGPGNTSAPIEVTLRNDTATITGTINGMATVNPNAAGEQPRIHIYAIPLFATTSNARESMPNNNGQFSFYNLAPGSYRVIAFDQPQEIDFHSSEGLAALSGQGQTTTVEANGSGQVQLDVVHAEQTE